MNRRLLLLLLLLASSLTSPVAQAGVKVESLPGGARYRVTFSHQPVIACERVALAGSFNGWSKTADPLRDPDGDGTFTLVKELPRGIHHYKFVLNGSVWQHDLDNQRTESDGHSGFNSVLELGLRAPSALGRAGDGAIEMQELVHDPAELPFACAVDGRRRLIVRLHVLSNDVERVWVQASPRPVGATRQGVAARRIATWEGRDVYEARLAFSRAPSKVRYEFLLEDGETTRRFPEGRQRFSVSTAQAARFETPEWVRDAVFYQVFPDRFCDGDPELSAPLPPRPAGRPWSVDDRFSERWGAKPSHFNFMGGDLPGVTQKVDYLQSLGVNTIYLNPIFKAASNHRYDASDYEQIDPALGTLDDFHDLRDRLRKDGMRMILDCVFNHTGDSHYAFQDAMKNGPRSRYWDWYFFDGGFPVVQTPKPNYRAWWGFSSLPQLNTKNPEVVRHLMGVGKKWLREGGAGWRLDVPNEVDAVNPEFWAEFRRRMRKQDPEAYLIGEIWTDARAWLKGDKFDAVMNYPLRSAVLEYIVKGGIDAAGFTQALSQQLATYPEPALRVQFNLLGSHDTPRVRTLAGGDARRVRLAYTFLFAYLGAPVIYYGDEVGMQGGKDPACRGSFPWDAAAQDGETLAHVRRLGATRAAERALRRGTVRFLPSQGQVAAFVREPELGERGRPIVCVLNASAASARVSVAASGLEGSPVELLLGRAVRLTNGRLELNLGPYESALVAFER